MSDGSQQRYNCTYKNPVNTVRGVMFPVQVDVGSKAMSICKEE